MNLLDTVRVLLSYLCDAGCLHLAMLQHDDRHRLLAKFHSGGSADHVDTGIQSLVFFNRFTVKVIRSAVQFLKCCKKSIAVSRGHVLDLA